MEAKPQSRSMQIPPYPHFRLGVASFDGLHHLRSDLGSDCVSQMQLLLTLFSVYRVHPLSDLVVFRPIHLRSPSGLRSDKTIDDNSCN